MTVMRNSNRWDASNAKLRDGQVFYDKRRRGECAGEMTWIDYGLSPTASTVIAEWLPAGGRGDLADLLYLLSVEGKLAGFEVAERSTRWVRQTACGNWRHTLARAWATKRAEALRMYLGYLLSTRPTVRCT